MKKFVLGAAVLCGAVAAHAGDVRGFVGMDVTGGGDTLASVTYTDNTTQSIKAGGMLQIGGGIEYRQPGMPFAVQAGIGYHFDTTHASNGDITFSRWPIELIAFWYPSEQVRLGLGLRHATNASLHSSGAADIGSTDFSAKTGGLVEAEWLVTPHVGVSLRYVDEKYNLAGHDIDGSHVGLGVGYYF
jgi:hypothetical protein